MEKRRPSRPSRNRICFWCPDTWRRRILEVIARDGRSQSAVILDAVIEWVREAERPLGK